MGPEGLRAVDALPGSSRTRCTELSLHGRRHMYGAVHVGYDAARRAVVRGGELGRGSLGSHNRDSVRSGSLRSIEVQIRSHYCEM